MTSIELKKFLFPFDKIRPVQAEFIDDLYKCLEKGQNFIAHAPTGLGKTAGALSPSIAYALKNDLRVIFLTGKNTQHAIAIETINYIKQKYDLDISAVDITGKKWLCPVPGVDNLFSSEFADYCRIQKEEGKCVFFNNSKKDKGPSQKMIDLVTKLQKISPLSSSIIKEMSYKEKLCAHEVSINLAYTSKVIVADYNFIFSQISENFINRAGIDLSKTILIVDEAHNLPKRVCSHMSHVLTSNIVKWALKEANEYGDENSILHINSLAKVLDEFEEEFLSNKSQTLISKAEFIQALSENCFYDEFVEELKAIAVLSLRNKKRSFCDLIALFLESWKGEDEGYARILSKKPDNLILSYKCLDPAVLTKDIFESAYASIVMSGTLIPPNMYRDVLGFDDAFIGNYDSPFPPSNRLNIILPKATTKFEFRSEDEYKSIAKICSDIANLVPGNIALFFPSYGIKDLVMKYFSPFSKKKILTETQKLSKDDKEVMLNEFRSLKVTGSVLAAVVSGNFSEGVDLPNDELQSVIVIGLPLEPPTPEVSALINYYDKKFGRGRGWGYGYMLPAMTRCFQAAGRCIRTETDRGIIVFLDSRYTNPMYMKCFPQDWDLVVAQDNDHLEMISKFFSK